MEAPLTTTPAHPANTGDFAQAFDGLLNVWNQHQTLRTDGATPAELFRSRASLDASRLSAARISTAR